MLHLGEWADWILYKGEGLSFVNGSSIVETAPLDGGSATKAEWDADEKIGGSFNLSTGKFYLTLGIKFL